MLVTPLAKPATVIVKIWHWVGVLASEVWQGKE